MQQGKHKLAGRTVTIKLRGKYDGLKDGMSYVVEDWASRVFGKSWLDMQGNPSCLVYAARGGFGDLPTDDNVVYGKIGRFGFLMHESELVV